MRKMSVFERFYFIFIYFFIVLFSYFNGPIYLFIHSFQLPPVRGRVEPVLLHRVLRPLDSDK